MTHKELVNAAAKWLRNSERCTIVIRELVTYSGEIPDVIGFWTGGKSVLVECKASRADFLRDREKVYRYCKIGMGDQRYFCAPKGLLTPEEIPEAWGLIEVYQNPVHKYHSLKITKEAHTFEDANKRSEITMLVSVLRRLEISTAVFVRQDGEQEDKDGNNDAPG